MKNRSLIAGRLVQLVIFDFDGTLIDAYKAVSESVNYTLTRLGYPAVGDSLIKRRVGWGERHLIRQFVRPRDFTRAVRIYRRHHLRALQRGTKFLPGARSLVADLKRKGYRIAIATNRATKFTRLIARHLGVLGDFDLILCQDRVKRPKPHPDIVREILRKFSLKPEQAVFVGDMTVDIQAGRRAGVCSIAVTTGSSTKKELAAIKPYRIIRRVSEVRRILRELEGNGG